MSWVQAWKGTLMNEWSSNAPVKNDPKLLAPTKILSLGGFCVRGRSVPSGEEVEIERYVAEGLVARGKAEFMTTT